VSAYAPARSFGWQRLLALCRATSRGLIVTVLHSSPPVFVPAGCLRWIAAVRVGRGHACHRPRGLTVGTGARYRPLPLDGWQAFEAGYRQAATSWKHAVARGVSRDQGLSLKEHTDRTHGGAALSQPTRSHSTRVSALIRKAWDLTPLAATRVGLVSRSTRRTSTSKSPHATGERRIEPSNTSRPSRVASESRFFTVPDPSLKCLPAKAPVPRDDGVRRESVRREPGPLVIARRRVRSTVRVRSDRGAGFSAR
jgi:hypothetical protein